MKKKTIYVCLIFICIVLILMLWIMMNFSPSISRENMISDNLGEGIVMADIPVPTSDAYTMFTASSPNPSTSTHAISSLGSMINSCFDNHTGNMTSECQDQINGIASSITKFKKSDITDGISSLSSHLS